MIAMMSKKFPCSIFRQLMYVLFAVVVVLAIARYDLRKEIIERRTDVANQPTKLPVNN